MTDRSIVAMWDTVLACLVIAVFAGGCLAFSGCINCHVDWHHEGDNNATVPVSALP